MSKVYKLTFEVVTDPQMSYFFKRNKLRCSEVEESYWRKVEKEDMNPWQQFNQLKEWEKSNEEPIRNVHLFESQRVDNWIDITHSQSEESK